MKIIHNTREEWLNAGVIALRPLFVAQAAPLPDALRVSCGFPSRRALSVRHRVVGQCFHANHGGNGVTELFISPLEADPLEVLAILAHEAGHSALAVGTGHKTPFKRLVYAIGLEGKPTHTVPGDVFKAWADPVLAQLGLYPHAAMTVTGREGVQGTRLLKAECGPCGYTVRVTRKWLDLAGPPLCPVKDCDDYGKPLGLD